MKGAGGHTNTSHPRSSPPSRAAAPTSAAKVFAASDVVGLSFQFPAMTGRRVATWRALALSLPAIGDTLAMLRSSDATASSRATTPSPFVAEVAAATVSFDFCRQWSRSPARASARRRPLARAGEGAKIARVARAVDASMTIGGKGRARACGGRRGDRVGILGTFWIFRGVGTRRRRAIELTCEMVTLTSPTVYKGVQGKRARVCAVFKPKRTRGERANQNKD